MELSQSNIPHPHGWKEIKVSGKFNTGACIMQEDYYELFAQHYDLWQATAFRLALSQQQASSWWDAPHDLQGLCPHDFLPPASNPWDFQVICQEKTLALVLALQACAETSRTKLGVLCRAVRELQQCMVPLMTIDRDDVMEASLLGQWRRNQDLPHPIRRGHPPG